MKLYKIPVSISINTGVAFVLCSSSSDIAELTDNTATSVDGIMSLAKCSKTVYMYIVMTLRDSFVNYHLVWNSSGHCMVAKWRNMQS